MTQYYISKKNTVIVTLMIGSIQQQYYTVIVNGNLLFQAGGDADKYTILQLHGIIVPPLPHQILLNKGYNLAT